MRIFTITIAALFCLAGNGFGQPELKKHFAEFDGTIVVYDSLADSITIVNPQRAETRLSPFSTFKIPNSLIALETAAAEDVDQVIRWDPEKYPAADWWPEFWAGEHNLRSGIKYSVVPLYRHLAILIGEAQMQQFVDRFDYGNRDISSGIDNFWLNGSMKISAIEQVNFLRKFYAEQFGVSSRTINLVKDILVQEKTDHHVLSAKTGAGSLSKDRALGWYVGYVEKKNNVYFFALNIEGSSFNEILKPRLVITKNILKTLGIIE